MRKESLVTSCVVGSPSLVDTRFMRSPKYVGLMWSLVLIGHVYMKRYNMARLVVKNGHQKRYLSR